MKKCNPERVYMDPRSLDYIGGIKAKEQLKKLKVPIFESRKVDISEDSIHANYAKAKKTVFITINTQKKLRSCKPSADYQFALSSSCPGHCEYCYLQTTQGEKPYIKVFVNIEDILQVIQQHIDSHVPNVTTFECGSITDPIALNYLTGNLEKCIEFFGVNPNGRLRVITKYDAVDSFLKLNHHKHTKVRFSLNTNYVIQHFEHNTANYEERIHAAKKIAHAGYPLGFIIAPIIIYKDWKEDYRSLFDKLRASIKDYEDEITFELIQHRFTARAKSLILSLFPNTKLDMNEEDRQLKWGPYGQFKYVYPKEKSHEMKDYMIDLIKSRFDNGRIEYFT